jgi:large subunit ribosomal protein L7/L12
VFGRSPQDEVDLAHLTDRVARLEATVAELQAQLAAVSAAARTAQAAGTSSALPRAEPAYLAEVRDLKARGKVINAIKVYREATGVGLREAKDAVERMV